MVGHLAGEVYVCIDTEKNTLARTGADSYLLYGGIFRRSPVGIAYLDYAPEESVKDRGGLDQPTKHSLTVLYTKMFLDSPFNLLHAHRFRQRDDPPHSTTPIWCLLTNQRNLIQRFALLQCFPHTASEPVVDASPDGVEGRVRAVH